MKLYLICGKARTGKDELANIFKDEYEKLGLKTCVLHITSPLYEYARNHFNWDGDKENKPREFLQKMGVEIIKQKMGMEFFLINRLCEDISILNNFFDIGIISDGRLIKEFEELKRRFPNLKTIRITRNNYVNNLTPEEEKHLTEVDLDNEYQYNYYVDNNSLEDLHRQVMAIIDKEGNKENE